MVVFIAFLSTLASARRPLAEIPVDQVGQRSEEKEEKLQENAKNWQSLDKTHDGNKSIDVLLDYRTTKKIAEAAEEDMLLDYRSAMKRAQETNSENKPNANRNSGRVSMGGADLDQSARFAFGMLCFNYYVY